MSLLFSRFNAFELGAALSLLVIAYGIYRFGLSVKK